MEIGDMVRWQIGQNSGIAYVCGEMHYSENGEVLLLADDGLIGMPINARHCQAIASGYIRLAGELRERYEARFPGQLRPLPAIHRPTGEG